MRIKTSLASALMLTVISLVLSQSANAQFGLPGGGKPRATIKEDNLVRLGDIFPTLKPFEGLKSYDSMVKDTVRYTTLGNAKYDNLFKEAAEMNAKVQQAKFLVSKYGKEPSSFATNWHQDLMEKANKTKTEIEKQLNDMTPQKAFFMVLKELVTKITEDNARAADLLKQLSGLNPADDFSPLDLDAVRKAIEQCRANLEGVKNNAPALIDEIAKLTK